MKHKFYLLPNTVEAELEFSIGKATPFRAHFSVEEKKGSVYSTTNLLRQIAIEKSELFKSGKIKLYKSFDVPDVGKKAVAPVAKIEKPAPAAETSEVHDEVSDREGVIALLKEKGAKPQKYTKSYKALQESIAELNLEFPNVDFAAWEAEFGK